MTVSNVFIFRQVTTIMKAVLKCPEKKAMDLTELVDKVGRAVIRVGDYKECVKARDIVERRSGWFAYATKNDFNREDLHAKNLSQSKIWNKAPSEILAEMVG